MTKTEALRAKSHANFHNVIKKKQEGYIVVMHYGQQFKKFHSVDVLTDWLRIRGLQPLPISLIQSVELVQVEETQQSIKDSLSWIGVICVLNLMAMVFHIASSK